MSRLLQFGPVDGAWFQDHAEYVAAVAAKEREAMQVFREFIAENAELLSYVSAWGDGRCGSLVAVMQDILLVPVEDRPKGYRKAKISQALRTAVFERDLYRCVRCGTHKELCADHIHPEVLGGLTALDNLQTLCRSCNSSKGARVQEVLQ